MAGGRCCSVVRSNNGELGPAPADPVQALTDVVGFPPAAMYIGAGLNDLVGAVALTPNGAPLPTFNEPTTGLLAANGITERAYRLLEGTSQRFISASPTVGQIDGRSMVLILYKDNAGVPPVATRQLARAQSTGPLLGWLMQVNTAGQIFIRLASAGNQVSLTTPQDHSDGDWHVVGLCRQTDDTVIRGTDLNASASATAIGSSLAAENLNLGRIFSLGQDLALCAWYTDAAIDVLTPASFDTLLADVHTAIVA